MLYDKNTQKYFDSVSSRDDYMCPAKHKESGFIEFINSFKRHVKVLDIGCGKGNFLKQAKETCPYAHLFGIDISIGMLAQAFNITSFICSSALLMPFKKETFDIVHIDALLHHLIGAKRHECNLQASKAISEAVSVLRVGGYLLIAEPIYEPEFVGFMIFYLKKIIAFITKNKRVKGLGAPVVSFHTEENVLKLLSKHLHIKSCTFKAWENAFYMKPLIRRRGRLYIVAKKEY